METTTYLGIDPEDLDDVLTKIERSYSISFDTNELRQVETFGQLCEAVTEKIKLAEVADCTSQQAFYKLRTSLTDHFPFERQAIRPTTELATLFPRSTRRASIKKLENAIGFSFGLLTASMYVVSPAVLLLLGSLVSGSVYGIAGFAVALITLFTARKLARQFTVQTVGELAEKLAREHYTKVRRDSCTVNKSELTDQIRQLFHTDLGIELNELQPDSLF